MKTLKQKLAALPTNRRKKITCRTEGLIAEGEDHAQGSQQGYSNAILTKLPEIRQRIYKRRYR